MHASHVTVISGDVSRHALHTGVVAL